MTRLILIAMVAGLAGAGDAEAKPKARMFGAGHELFGGPRLGVQLVDMTEELRTFFGAPRDAGMLVSRITPDSPAAKAGVQVGDVIVEVDGGEVEDVGDIFEALADRKSGDEVKLVVVRAKATQVLTAKLSGDEGVRRFHLDKGAPGTYEFPGFDGSKMFVLEGGDIAELKAKLEALEKRLDALENRR